MELAPPNLPENKFISLRSTPSDINEHADKILEYTKKCRSVLELGRHTGTLTWIFLHGLLTGRAKRTILDPTLLPPSFPPFPPFHLIVITEETQTADFDSIRTAAAKGGIQMKSCIGSSVDFPLEQTIDMLFINTWHCAYRLREELEAYSARTIKFIIIRCTVIDWELSEAVRCHDNIYKKFRDNPGSTVLDICKGLKYAIEEFLGGIGKDWFIAQHFVHQYGMMVLKRKEVKEIKEMSHHSNTLTRV